MKVQFGWILLQYFYLPPSPIPTHVSPPPPPPPPPHPTPVSLACTTCDVEDSTVAQRLQFLTFSLFSPLQFNFTYHISAWYFLNVWWNMLMQLFWGSWTCHMNIMGSSIHATHFSLTGYDEWDRWATEGSRVRCVHLGHYWFNSKNQVLYFTVFSSWLTENKLSWKFSLNLHAVSICVPNIIDLASSMAGDNLF